MVDQLGPERVLFGSDFPFIDQRMSLGRVAYADLDPESRRAILGENSRRLFGWRPLPAHIRPSVDSVSSITGSPEQGAGR
jgi:hypothetical protein